MRFIGLYLLICLGFAACQDQARRLENANSPAPAKYDSLAFSNLLAAVGDSIMRSPDLGFQMALEVEALGHREAAPHVVASSRNWQGIYFGMRSEYDTALQLFYQAYDIFDSLSYPKGLNTVVANLALTYDYLGDINGAIALYERSLDLTNRPRDSASLIIPLTNLGAIHSDIGDYSKAVDFYDRSITIATQLGNEADLVNAIFNLGTVYLDQADYSTALQYYQRAATLADSASYPYQLAGIQEGLGKIYRNTRQYLLAEEAFKTGLRIAEDSDLPESYSSLLNALAQLHYEQGMLEIALGQLVRNIAFCEPKGLVQEHTEALLTITKIYTSLGQYRQAQERASKGLKLAEQIQHLRLQKELHLALANVMEQVNQPALTFHHERSARILQDSIFSQDRQEATRHAQVRLDTQLKEQENVALQQDLQLKGVMLENRKIQVRAASISLAIFLIAAILLFFQNRKIRKLNTNLAVHNEDQRKLLLLLSHDFRTPLAYIYSWLNLHQLGSRDGGKVGNRFIEYCLSTLKRMDNYVGYIIAQVRREEFKLQPDFQHFDIRAQLQAWVEQLRPIAQQLGVALELQAEDEHLPVFTDPMLLHHAFDNLSTNAMKYAETGSVVRYQLRRTGPKGVAIKIENTVDDLALADYWPSKQHSENGSEHLLHKSNGLGLSLVDTYMSALRGQWGIVTEDRLVQAWIKIGQEANEGSDTDAIAQAKDNYHE